MTAEALPLHRWDVAPSEAREIQAEFARRVERQDRLGEVRHVAGIDVGFEDSGRVTRAAVALLSFPDLALVEHAVARVPTSFPYVPGLLSFREAPAALAALHLLGTRPDLILYDGQGLSLIHI